MVGRKLQQGCMAKMNDKFVISVASTFPYDHQSSWFVVLGISDCKEIPRG